MLFDDAIFLILPKTSIIETAKTPNIKQSNLSTNKEKHSKSNTTPILTKANILLCLLNFNFSLSSKVLFSLSTGAKKKITILDNNVTIIKMSLFPIMFEKVISVRNEIKIIWVKIKQAI